MTRARPPLAGPRRIVVLGCTRGAGQTLTALMTGHILATVRGIPVAALDLNPGPTSLAARRSPAASIDALLASQPGDDGDPGPGARLDVIGRLPATAARTTAGGTTAAGTTAAGTTMRRTPWTATTSGGSPTCWPNGTC